MSGPEHRRDVETPLAHLFEQLAQQAKLAVVVRVRVAGGAWGDRELGDRRCGGGGRLRGFGSAAAAQPRVRKEGHGAHAHLPVGAHPLELTPHTIELTPHTHYTSRADNTHAIDHTHLPLDELIDHLLVRPQLVEAQHRLHRHHVHRVLQPQRRAAVILGKVAHRRGVAPRRVLLVSWGSGGAGTLAA